jgi:hypothetical protein
LLTPEARLEGAERGFASFGIDRFVDALQRGRYGFTIFPGDEIEAVAQRVNDAGLHDCPRKDGSDRLREALEAVDNGDQDVFAPRFSTHS